jgi:cytochrome P450
MSHTILLLAMFPDIQEKVIAEMREVLPDQDSDITPEQLQKLVYLKQTINEAMRLLAIVPLYCRRLTGEVVLSK